MVSVIIPTFNRSTLLEQCIQSILNQTYDNYELIIVDDGSSDETIGIVQKYCKICKEKVFLLRQDNAGPAQARNRGLERARGEIVLFIDDDMEVIREWIERMAEHFKDPSVGIVGGKTILKQASPFSPLQYEENEQGAMEDTVLTIPTNNSGFLKRVLQRIGGFDTRFIYPGGEDTDICIRVLNLHYTLKINNEAVAYHNERYTLRGWLKKNYRYGYGQATFLDLHPEYRAFYCYILMPLQIVNDTGRFLKNHIRKERRINFSVIVKIFVFAFLVRVCNTVGRFVYVLRHRKYALLFLRIKGVS